VYGSGHGARSASKEKEKEKEKETEGEKEREKEKEPEPEKKEEEENLPKTDGQNSQGIEEHQEPKSPRAVYKEERKPKRKQTVIKEKEDEVKEQRGKRKSSGDKEQERNGNGNGSEKEKEKEKERKKKERERERDNLAASAPASTLSSMCMKKKKKVDIREKCGGILARDERDEPLEEEELYFMGVIDILTVYNFKKKSEHTIKSLLYDSVLPLPPQFTFPLRLLANSRTRKLLECYIGYSTWPISATLHLLYRFDYNLKGLFRVYSSEVDIKGNLLFKYVFFFILSHHIVLFLMVLVGLWRL